VESLAVGEPGVEELEKAEASGQVDREKEKLAIRRASERARTARWDLNIAIFLFAVMIIVIILLFQGISLEIVSPIAIFGLSMVWLCGWRQGRQLYDYFLEEELAKLEYERTRGVEEVVEEAVHKALRQRMH